MRKLHPVVVLVSLAIVSGLLAGCSSDPDPSRAGTLSWIRDRPEVAKASVVNEVDEPSRGQIEITLEDGTSDGAVEAFVQDFREHFRPIQEDYVYRLRVDDFVATLTDYGPDDTVGWEGPPLGESLDRALWLRRDGRATSYDDASGANSPYDRERVNASSADVAQLALDLDAYDSETEGEFPVDFTVTSPDETSLVSWTNRQDGHLDRSAIQRLVDLQDRFPGTTGRSGDGDVQVLFFDSADIDAKMLARIPRLLGDAGFSADMIVGWGPVVFRTVSQLERLAKRQANRRTYAALAQISGLEPGLGGNYPGPGGIKATSQADLHEALAILRKNSAGISDLGYNRESGLGAPSVVRAGPDDSPAWLRAVDIVIALPDVEFFDAFTAGSARTATATVTVKPTISDADLTAILTTAHGLAPKGRIYATAARDSSAASPTPTTSVVALNADGTLEAPTSESSDPETQALVDRLTGLWATVART